MNTKAPDLFGVNDAELAEEISRIEIAQSIEWSGPITIISGVRDPGSAHALPVLIIRSTTDDIHFVALPGGSVD